MQLYTLLEDNAKTSLENLEITGLTDDSRKVQSGMVFACIRGERFDGHTAAAEALEKGAAAVLVDHDLGLGDRQILTEDTRALYPVPVPAAATALPPDSPATAFAAPP